jgi:hypothetical protein
MQRRTRVAPDPDRSAEVAPYIDQAEKAERQARALEAELRRTQSELEATRGILRTVCKIAAPYNVK